MGYRLDIAKIERYEDEEIKNIYYGTKLYGYGLELDESLSYQFLKTIHKFDGTELFDYGITNECILNYEELRMFLKLYNIDYDNYKTDYSYNKKKDYFIEQEEINDILINVGKYEFSNFIISWV